MTPEPWDMPGYDAQVIMAAGAFVSGSSIELSADAPIKPPSSGVLDQGAYYHVGSYVAGLPCLHELPVAVVHHADDVRLDCFYESYQLSYLSYGKGGPGLVALGALDGVPGPYDNGLRPEIRNLCR